jgi:hypothetical protein
MNFESMTEVANIVGAPAFAVLCCFGIVGFALYKILPRLKTASDGTKAIKADRERKQKEYADKFADLEKGLAAEIAARKTLETIMSQRLDQGDSQFKNLERKLDDMQKSFGEINAGVASLGGKIEMLLKIKGV